MCIRDSDSPNLAALLETLAVRAGEWGAFHLVAEIDETSPCLLYTSDAADERSSVDLGGRRIIKKKTTTQHHAQVNITDKLSLHTP